MAKGTTSHRQNFLEKQELVKKHKMAAGLVSERFPEVTEITLRLTYYQRAVNPVLMVRTMTYLPTNYAYFQMDCMREGCTDGGFDLSRIISSLVKNREKTAKGKIVCRGKGESLPVGHASIAYEVSIASKSKK